MAEYGYDFRDCAVLGWIQREWRRECRYRLIYGDYNGDPFRHFPSSTS